MLSDSLAALEVESTDTKCPVSRWIEENPEAGEILQRLLDGSVPTRRIYETLKREGVKIGRDTLAHHRQKRCVCANFRGQS